MTVKDREQKQLRKKLLNLIDMIEKEPKLEQKRLFSEEEVFNIIDDVFHAYASDYRQQAEEWFENYLNRQQ